MPLIQETLARLFTAMRYSGQGELLGQIRGEAEFFGGEAQYSQHQILAMQDKELALAQAMIVFGSIRFPMVFSAFSLRFLVVFGFL